MMKTSTEVVMHICSIEAEIRVLVSNINQPVNLMTHRETSVFYVNIAIKIFQR